MKKFYSIVLVVMAVLALGCFVVRDLAEKPGIAMAAEEQEIRGVLENLIKGYEKEDIKLWAGSFDDDPGMVNIGVGANHYFVGWEELKQGLESEWAVVSDTKITVSDLRITVLPDGEHAWSTSRFDWKANVGDQTIKQACRQTAIFEKKGGVWKVVHFHDSVGIGAE